MSGSVMNYSITFSNMISNIWNFPCMRECTHTFDVPSTACSGTANTNIVISASNIVGQGPPSDPVTIGTTTCTLVFNSHSSLCTVHLQSTLRPPEVLSI